MARSKMRLKGVYGKPWSKMAGGIPISKKVLEEVGQIIVDAVIAECKKDFARSSFPENISGDTKESLYDSFGWRIKGKSTIEITSTWPIEGLVEGKGWQLWPPTRKAATKRVVPIMEGGTVVFRTAPFTTKQGTWIHPGFGKMSFIQRGIRKGREKAAAVVAAEVGRALVEGNPFR